MSMKNRGLPRRVFSAARAILAVITAWGLPVEAMTMSTSPNTAPRSSRLMALPPQPRASSTARSRVRLATCTLLTPWAMRCSTASSAISPAPTTRALSPSRESNIFLASSTAAKEMDTAAPPMLVSERTRLAT